MPFKKLLKKYSKKDLKIYIVDGKRVRDKMDVSFGLGGHDKVYKYIPSGEVWIEKLGKDMKPILLHELFERKLMKSGSSYDEAHKGATIAESFYRRNPKLIEKRLKELL
jgi:hypothetical protein